MSAVEHVFLVCFLMLWKGCIGSAMHIYSGGKYETVLQSAMLHDQCAPDHSCTSIVAEGSSQVR